MHVRDLAGDRGCPHPDRITPGSSVSSIAPIAFWSGYQILKSARGNEIAGFLVNFPRCRSKVRELGMNCRVRRAFYGLKTEFRHSHLSF